MKKSILALIVIALCIITASSAFAAQVAHWDFSETTGLVAHDSVGSYDGIVDNSEGTMAWTADSWLGDGALAMSNSGDVGTGGVVVINETGNTFKANSFTISAWIKPDYVRDRIVLAKTGSWSDIYYKGYELRTDGWGRKLMWYAGGSGGTFSDGIHLYGLEQNMWYNIIGMRDGNEVKLYVNGMLIGTKTITQPMNFAGTNPLTIGGLSGTNGKGWSFDGVIDDVRYYNHALSQSQIDQIYGGDVIIGHDPFTAEYLYAPELDTLSVQGYADLPASSAEVRFKDHTGDYNGTSTCVPVIQNYPLGQNATPDYTATFTDVAANWEKGSYNLEVAFFTDDSCANATGAVAYGGEFDALRIMWIEDQLDQLNQTLQEYQNSTNENLTAIWDEFNATWEAINNNSADIDWIEGQIADLWDAIDDLENMTMIAFDYFSAEHGGPSLNLYGYAPSDAQSVQIRFYGSLSGGQFYQCVPVDQAVSPEFSLDLNLSDWEIDSYAIEGYFYDGPGCMGNPVSPMAYGNTFDDLLNDWLHENELGFGLMDTQTFEVWNPQDSFTRKISWAFTAPKDGWYWFELVNPTSDNGEDISKVFAGGTSYWINSHETKYFKNRNVLFPPKEGSYKVKLKAHNAFTSDTMKSNAFRLIIDDLAQPWPHNSAGVREISIANYSNVSSIYWTNHMVVDAVADLISDHGWADTTGCHVNYWNRSIAPWVLVKNGTNATCGGPIRLTNDDVGAASAALVSGETSRITICGTPVVGNASYTEVCADVTLGFDDTPPVIDEESLDPGTSGIVNGLWNFSADVTDDGEIARVWFTLTNKTNASQVCPLLPDANNTVGDTWVVAYNTSSGNCTPDGYYNFTVYAIDYAGNEANLTIDPIIDNTPPVVQSVDVSGYTGSGWTVTSEITDNLAGVDQATAKVYEMNCSAFQAETNVTTCVNESYFNETTNSTQNQTVCTVTTRQNCFGTFECTLPENATPVKVVTLDGPSPGDALNGTWTGSIDGEALSPDKHYMVEVTAYDRASNQNNASEGDTSFDLYSHVGYTVTVDVPDTAIQGVNFAVSGSVVDTKGDPVAAGRDVLLSPWSITKPTAFGGLFAASESLNTVGDNVVTATFTPDAACQESFSGTDTISITRASGGGGGGGGGGSFCSDGYVRENDRCVKVEEPPKEEPPKTGGSPQDVSGGSQTQENGGNAPLEVPEPPADDGKQPPADNPITGAVTGGGLGSLMWLWILLGVIVALLGLWLLVWKK